MQELSYKLEQFDFEGPLELLLALIQKNKLDIADIPLAILCDQYIEYINEAERMDMELAAEFIAMASRLMLMKSRMLLPRSEENKDEESLELSDILLRAARARALSSVLCERYSHYGRRTVKDTDEISPDRTFVAEQDMAKLTAAAKRVLAYKRSEKSEGMTKITPIIKRPIVPVEEKIVGIISHFKKKKKNSLSLILEDAKTRPELIAIFIGVLELIKQGKLVIVESPNEFTSLHGLNTQFEITDKKLEEISKESLQDEKAE